METKKKVLEFRDRLDKTLGSSELVNEDSVKHLVRNQLLRSSSYGIEGDTGDVVERRTMEVTNILKMLRCTSENDKDTLNTHDTSHNDWKLKQDNGQLRVMYREGPPGTPFHTLLAEGYVDGPLDVCLCASWESALYRKWWPQFTIPPFKIITSTCLKKIRIGEQLSLVRMKVPWPLSAREAIVHYFMLEYLENDLIIVLINTISDSEHIDAQTHGFTIDGIPEANDIVRIDVVGGFALQRINSNRSYFRTIANIDIKIDFVPPALINFISRQLIGSGFKLYQKAVASVANGDENYSKALEGPMYVRLRESMKNKDKNLKPLYREKDTVISEEAGSNENFGKVLEMQPTYIQNQEDLESFNKNKKSRSFHDEKSVANLTKEHTCETPDEYSSQAVDEEPTYTAIQDGKKSSNNGYDLKLFCSGQMYGTHVQKHTVETPAGHTPGIDQTSANKIEENETEAPILSEEDQRTNNSSITPTNKKPQVSKRRAFISLEVEWALGVLDKAIGLIGEHGYVDNKRTESLSTDQELPKSQTATRTSWASSGDSEVYFNVNDALGTDSMDRSSDEFFSFHDSRPTSVDHPSVEAEDTQYAADHLEQNSRTTGRNQHGVSSPPNGTINSGVGTEAKSTSGKSNGLNKEADTNEYRVNEGSVSVGRQKLKPKKKKKRVCFCL